MHSDPSVLDAEFREDCLRRASNYVEVTRMADGEINIENQYNFGVQTSVSRHDTARIELQPPCRECQVISRANRGPALRTCRSKRSPSC